MTRWFRSGALCNRRPSIYHITRRWSSSKTSDPLRILFCGSDEFSIASLRALHREQQARPEFIKSIDVVSRPPKRVGRGLKSLREVPIAEEARKLHLNLHQIDTFTRWQPPKPDRQAINLVIAVSFGLLVPPRILNAAKYGGLNVHPSMLPDFRGPSPLHHTLLHGLSKTGVSVQTLDSKKFDHGLILAQTPEPGVDIPKPDDITVTELTDFLAPKGAELLLQVIEDRCYVPPLEEIGTTKADQMGVSIRTAPKLTTEDRHIDWKTWTADEIVRKQRVIGPLWNLISTESWPEGRRVIWEDDFEKIDKSSIMGQMVQEIEEKTVHRSFRAMLLAQEFENKPKVFGQVVMRTCDGGYLWVDAVKFDGQQTDTIDKAFKHAKVMSVELGQPSIFLDRSWKMPE